ncbi:MAG TPA: class I SAM-dependent methyltransferase [Solirubrobacteraceae bacterium]|nr:class I SAM-dependent methyltransferase [Solirubrobacteraceae bacterium]
MGRSPQAAAAAGTWDRLAARYGAQEHWECAAIDAALRVAAPRCDERLVDLATGTGLLLRRLADRPAAPREAVGIDRSPRMLAAAGRLPPGWTVLNADARAVPLPDGWADIVTCAYVLHLLDAEQRAELLAEARRLLAPRPASRLVIVTVWSDRVAVRATLRVLQRTMRDAGIGLRPVDPTADLARSGFALTQRVRLPRHGYPSLVLGAKPAGAS